MKILIPALLMLGALLGGLFSLSRAVKHSYIYLASHNWVEIDASVETLDMTSGSSRGASAGKARSNRVKVWETIGTYRYRFDDMPYSSDRIFLAQGETSDYTQQKTAYDTMKRHKTEGTMMPVLVNPKHPAQAVVFRVFDWVLVLIASIMGLFLTLIGGVGLMACFSRD